MEFAELQAELIAAEKRVDILKSVLSELNESAVEEIAFIQEEIRSAKAYYARISSLLSHK